MTIGVYFHQDGINIMDACGFSELHAGVNELTETQAIEIVLKMRRLEPSVPSALTKRFRSYYMQIALAFGPEFVDKYTR